MIRFAPHFVIDVITRTGRGNYITNGNMVVVFDETIFERIEIRSLCLASSAHLYFLFRELCAYLLKCSSMPKC